MANEKPPIIIKFLLGGLSKALIVLIRKISNGLWNLYKPIYDLRVARTEAKIKELNFNTDSQLQKRKLKKGLFNFFL